MIKQESNIVWHIIAFITIMIWGITFVSTKVLIADGLSPAQIFTLRFIIAYVLLLAFSYKKMRSDNWRDELQMFFLGLAGGSIYFLSENEALRFSTATNVSLIVCSCPLFTALFFRLFVKGTRLSKWQVGGTLVAFVGMITVVMNGQFVLHLSPLGDSLALVACISWAVYSLLMKSVTHKYSSMFITRKVFFYGLIGIIPYYFFVPDMPKMSVLLKPEVIYNILFLGAIASMLCFLTWTLCLKKLGVMRTTNYTYLNPFATIVFASWILGEQITVFFIAGSALILFGLYLSSKKVCS